MEKVVIALRAYITQYQIDQALNKLLVIFSFSESQLADDVRMLLARWHKLNSDVRQGIIEDANEDIERNKIIKAVLELINEIADNPAGFIGYLNAENDLDETVKDRKESTLAVIRHEQADIGRPDQSGEILNDLDLAISERMNNELTPESKAVFFERIAYIRGKSRKIDAIWIDDALGNNEYESRILSSIGLQIDFAESSEQAYGMLKEKTYDIILSDISRNDHHDEGIRFHKRLIADHMDIPLIFYTGFANRAKGVPPYAFGIADLPNNLVHLVIDVIERIPDR